MHYITLPLVPEAHTKKQNGFQEHKLVPSKYNGLSLKDSNKSKVANRHPSMSAVRLLISKFFCVFVP